MSSKNRQQHPHGNAGRPRDIDSLLIEAFLVGSTVVVAAGHAKCAPKTAYRRLRDPAFKAKLAEERQRVVQRVADRLTWHTLTCINRLAELVQNPDPGVALDAVKTMLHHVCRLRELESFEQRLIALENATPAPAPPRPRRAG
jgi:hypothetical protein